MKKTLIPSPIPAELQTKTVGLLQPVVADLKGLYDAGKQAHWLVMGELFNQLHGLFESIAQSAADYADTIAERLVTLNGVPERKISDLAIGEDRDGLMLAQQMEDAVLAVAQSVAKAQADCLAAGEQVTANMLMAVGEGLQKWLWQLHAYVVEEDESA